MKWANTALLACCAVCLLGMLYQVRMLDSKIQNLELTSKQINEQIRAEQAVWKDRDGYRLSYSVAQKLLGYALR
jgi:hypothetical protein